jgi:hypothetical protein
MIVGTEIYFYRGDHELGHVHFSAFTLRRQHAAYETDYLECLTYDENGEEMVGPKGVDDYHGRFAPDWPRAATRAARLLALCEARPADDHRRQYDLERLRAFHKLIVECAESACASDCAVEIHD